jgi:hypothetical protein
MGPQPDQVASKSAARLLETIVRQLGLGAPLLLPLACNSSSPADGDEGGVTTNQSSGNDAPEGETSSSTGDTDTDGETGTEEETGEIKFDFALLPDGPPPPLCWSNYYYDPQQFPPEFAGCSFGPLDPGLTPVYLMICIELPDGESCDDTCVEGLCEGMDECLYGTYWETCGPIEIDGECCTMIVTEEPPAPGRPFMVAGQLRLAVAPEQLSPVAAHWLDAARGEHASIAAFARFVTTLLRFGAPARLVADALAAARDEARHTRDTLALARHAALAWRFVAWVLDTRPDLHGIIERTLTEALARRPAASPHDASLRARWRAIGMRELVSPCARQLLARGPAARTMSSAPTRPR